MVRKGSGGAQGFWLRVPCRVAATWKPDWVPRLTQVLLAGGLSSMSAGPLDRVPSVPEDLVADSSQNE